jgi:hypothetical protein
LTLGVSPVTHVVVELTRKRVRRFSIQSGQSAQKEGRDDEGRDYVLAVVSIKLKDDQVDEVKKWLESKGRIEGEDWELSSGFLGIKLGKPGVINEQDREIIRITFSDYQNLPQQEHTDLIGGLLTHVDCNFLPAIERYQLFVEELAELEEEIRAEGYKGKFEVRMDYQDITFSYHPFDDLRQSLDEAGAARLTVAEARENYVEAVRQLLKVVTPTNEEWAVLQKEDEKRYQFSQSRSDPTPLDSGALEFEEEQVDRILDLRSAAKVAGA